MLGLQSLVLPFLISCVLSYDGVQQLRYDLERAEDYFPYFVKTHKKTYQSDSEKKLRFEIFKHNLGLINEKNKFHGYIVSGITEYSDLTSDEFISRHTGFKGTSKTESREGGFCTVIDDKAITVFNISRNFDWRTKNVVTPVKDQRDCGTCWAFASIGNIESLHAIKTGDLVSLSEQQLLDCDDRDCGCCGGFPEKAFQEPYMPESRFELIPGHVCGEPRFCLPVRSDWQIDRVCLAKSRLHPTQICLADKYFVVWPADNLISFYDYIHNYTIEGLTYAPYKIYFEFRFLSGVGLATEKEYPYTAKQSDCREIHKPRVFVDGCIHYDITDENKLRQILVENGPAIIGVDAEDLQLFKAKGTILKKCKFNKINHVVLLVGYGEENDVPYWIIKNSWNTTWGDNGYIKVKTGINACGMLNSFVSYATLA